MHTPVAENVYTCCFAKNEYTSCRKCIYHIIVVVENEYTCCFVENEYISCKKCIYHTIAIAEN